jgi:hypothetical protein
LMVSAAMAGCASAKAVAPASQNAVLMRFSPLPLFVSDPFCAQTSIHAASTTFGFPHKPSATCEYSCTIIRGNREWQEL